MRDDDLLDPGGQRRVDGGVDLGPAEVPGGEHELMPRHHLEHAREAIGRELHGLARHARGGELVLDLRQTGCLAGLGPSSLASFSESTVGSQTMRAPPRAAISTACALSPPTPALRAIAPSASMPGTAPRTTAAALRSGRSAT